MREKVGWEGGEIVRKKNPPLRYTGPGVGENNISRDKEDGEAAICQIETSTRPEKRTLSGKKEGLERNQNTGRPPKSQKETFVLIKDGEWKERVKVRS